MEQKPGVIAYFASNTYSLLIEPVWNRNKMDGVFVNSKHNLLIEPVWNRNGYRHGVKCQLRRPFNRTSMEQKRRDGQQLFIYQLPFNRTSMEQKHDSMTILANIAFSLLIEPVWNRNFLPGLLSLSISILLIEPVWNRNFLKLLVITPTSPLLIEPVWNRNNQQNSQQNQNKATFNRTSMEQKLIYLQSCEFEYNF